MGDYRITSADRPCLSSRPVAAFSVAEGHDVTAYGEYLGEQAGQACVSRSCAARRACPPRPEQAYSREQSIFHMNAFLRGNHRPNRGLDGGARESDKAG